ncbi:MAG: flagellar hook-associated protein FlgL [Deltaproteobacteria bacterium]|nr:flagellar hook-associated protein FlgL [Deltaproteobacteria bacterium]
MRITPNTTSANALYNIQQGREKLDRLQELTSSGQKVNRPSDKPISAGVLLDIGDRLKTTDQFSSNISKAKTWVNFSSTALTGITDILNEVGKILNTMSGSSDPSQRQNAKEQLGDLKKQIVEMANSRMGDQFIFGGAINNIEPFNKTNNDYAGDSTQLTIEIAPGITQAMSITGDRLILGKTTPPAVADELPDYGDTDILKTIDDLIIAVGDDTTPSDAAGITQGRLAIQDGIKQVNYAISDNLSRLTRLDNMSKLNENNKNTLQSIVGDIQNVDYAQLGVELNNQKNAFEASLAATAKISQLSMLDFM